MHLIKISIENCFIIACTNFAHNYCLDEEEVAHNDPVGRLIHFFRRIPEELQEKLKIPIFMEG